jgi:hypothetical protein
MTDEPRHRRSFLSCGFLVYMTTMSFAATAHGDDAVMPELPDGLAIKLVVPKDKPTRATVNTGFYVPRIEITNETDAAITLWPFVSINVLHEDGTPVSPSMHIGRWGLIGAPSMLEDIKYVTLPAGKTHAIPVAINAYGYDPHAIRGWRLVPGKTYRVVLHYEFDRAKVIKAFGAGCKEPDAPEQPWNKIAPVNWVKELELKL